MSFLSGLTNFIKKTKVSAKRNKDGKIENFKVFWKFTLGGSKKKPKGEREENGKETDND